MTGPGLRVRKHHRTGKGSSGLRVLRYSEEGDNLTWDSHKILGAAQHVLPMSDVEVGVWRYSACVPVCECRGFALGSGRCVCARVRSVNWERRQLYMMAGSWLKVYASFLRAVNQKYSSPRREPRLELGGRVQPPYSRSLR